MNMKEAIKHCSELGFTLKRTSDEEVAVYLKGEGEEWPGTYYTNDLVDAVSTARAMRNQLTVSAAIAVEKKLP